MKKFRIIPLILATALSAACLAGCGKSEGSGTAGNKAEATANREPMRDMTTMELVRDMGLGINLGNTLECAGLYAGSVTDYETAWGSPVITKEMIQGYKDCGFGVVRIPVAWSNMMNVRTYEISPDYIARVKQIIDWCQECDLYAIMNIHWDGGWWDGFGKEEEKREKCFARYESIWTQLSEAFRDYDDRLMFESLNEELGWDSLWNRYSNQGDKELAYSIANDINQRFVNIVRASGGNNAKRHLLIAGYGTDIDLTCDELFRMPDDPENRCAVSVHYYTPSTFAILEEDADWGKCRSEWGTDADMAELEKNMNKMKEHYIDKGIPVIIGEYGCPIKNKDVESVRKYLSSVSKAAYERQMCPVLWDITQTHYDRETRQFRDPEVLKGIMAAKG